MLSICLLYSSLSTSLTTLSCGGRHVNSESPCLLICVFVFFLVYFFIFFFYMLVICLFVYLHGSLFACLFVIMLVCLLVCLFVCYCACMFTCLLVHVLSFSTCLLIANYIPFLCIVLVVRYVFIGWTLDFIHTSCAPYPHHSLKAYLSSQITSTKAQKTSSKFWWQLCE